MLTLTQNTFPAKKKTDVLPKMHPRLEHIDFHVGKSEKHANGCRAAMVACTKYAAYAEKWSAQREKPDANNKRTRVARHRFT